MSDSLCAHTVLEGISDDNIGFIGLLEDSTLRRTEEDNKRLRSFDGRVLDVVHDSQTASLEKNKFIYKVNSIVNVLFFS